MTIKQSNYIKLIAIISMLIDHIGVILLPNMIVFRILGRIAFPLFAYQLGTGYRNTKNFYNYLQKLILFGVMTQLLYSLAVYYLKINGDLGKLNIFFTLALGLLAIYFLRRNKFVYLFAIMLVPYTLQHINASLDYGLYGILLILILFELRGSFFQMTVAMALITLTFCLPVFGNGCTQMFCLMSVPFIAFPLKLKLKIPSFFFYLFYPLHLAALYIISIII